LPGSNPQQGQPGANDARTGSRDTTTQRENTPDKPGPGAGEKPKGDKPGESGTPDGNKKAEGDGKQLAGNKPAKLATEAVEHTPDAREAWGYLPEHARDVFRTQGGGQMPARYREWIDAYYKKLNQKP
jgi:hypothetical protein